LKLSKHMHVLIQGGLECAMHSDSLCEMKKKHNDKSFLKGLKNHTI